MSYFRKDSLKVAIDLTALLPEATGVDHYMKRLVLTLPKIDDGNQYTIFVNYEDRHLYDGVLPSNFLVLPFCLRARAVRLLFQQVVLPAVAGSWGADVVHSPSFIMPLFKGRQRHVLTIHDMTFFSLPDCHIALRRNALFRCAVLESIRRANIVVVPSHATRQAILDVMPQFYPQHIRVIPNGIGDEFRLLPIEGVRDAISRLQLPPSYILYVGTIEPRKNLERLVESYRRLMIKGEIDEHLVLAGRLGWGYKDLLVQLANTELQGKVHLTGYISQDDLPWVYAGARLFVYPSIAEGFGFPPLEAMACGVPTVSSLSSSLAENLQGAAELVPPDDAEALTGAMRQLLNDEGRRAKCREEGLARAAKFRWEETARHTLDSYLEAACMGESQARDSRR
jgi:glycosyltransferase involved in cell wall biosynthesis